jgi:peptidoglycan hydrolase-like protein with peptidoglycan-binding domain
VVECQEDLLKLGYNIGKAGADGIFGKDTEAGVINFQADHGLKEDGIVGQQTWAALDAAVGPEPPKEKLYTATIQHVTAEQAEELKTLWPDATITEE